MDSMLNSIISIVAVEQTHHLKDVKLKGRCFESLEGASKRPMKVVSRNPKNPLHTVKVADSSSLNSKLRD